MLAAHAHLAAQVPVLVLRKRVVGLEAVAGSVVSQRAEEGGLGDMAPGVVAGVQGLVVAEAGDALASQVEGVVDLQAAVPQVAADLGQAAQTAGKSLLSRRAQASSPALYSVPLSSRKRKSLRLAR